MNRVGGLLLLFGFCHLLLPTLEGAPAVAAAMNIVVPWIQTKELLFNSARAPSMAAISCCAKPISWYPRCCLVKGKLSHLGALIILSLEFFHFTSPHYTSVQWILKGILVTAILWWNLGRSFWYSMIINRPVSLQTSLQTFPWSIGFHLMIKRFFHLQIPTSHLNGVCIRHDATCMSRSFANSMAGTIIIETETRHLGILLRVPYIWHRYRKSEFNSVSFMAFVSLDSSAQILVSGEFGGPLARMKLQTLWDPNWKTRAVSV